jgi:hypothetical protein
LRAYITVRTHPTIVRVRLEGQRLTETKEGYAEWQLLEVPEEKDGGMDRVTKEIA